MEKSDRRTVCIYTDQETYERLRALAGEMHLNVSATVTRLIWERQLQSDRRPPAEVTGNG